MNKVSTSRHFQQGRPNGPAGRWLPTETVRVSTRLERQNRYCTRSLVLRSNIDLCSTVDTTTGTVVETRKDAHE